MAEDFFSNFSNKVSGIQKVFLVMGTVWLAGTVITLFSSPSSKGFLAWVIIWLGFFAAYKLAMRTKMKSSPLSVIAILIGLILWKVIVGVLLFQVTF